MEGEKIKNTSKYPTSLIVRGLNYTGIEIAKTLVEQGGYVIIIDELSFQVEELIDQVGDERLITILDMASISSLEENIRRLDYVYYFGHESKSYLQEISTQEFLQQSNYLDTILDLSLKFEAKFLLTTSIKAHQLTLETTNLNLDNPSNNFSSPNYTETEVQRYAENLVLEYNEKLGLDSRIIRVGEILGKGLNPNMDSSYLELILNAVKGESLKIRGDGLETDFYIHYIDAARGLIKSMFSQATKGRVYSLAIPEEISTLSIAYKVSELEPGAGRIEFVENDNKLPPLRLYKPAPNLESIGWENKIGLERSIAQTIEYVKEKEDQFFPGKGTSKGEALTEESENVYPDPANFEGALARLISERKLHEKSRIGSVVLANEKLREKLKSRNSSSIVKKVSRNSFWIFENFKSQFRFLKNITLREFIFYTILLFLIFLGYIFILSPILNIVGNGITIYRKISNIESSLNDNDFKNISSNLSSINSDISEIQLRFEEIRYIFTVSGNIERYNNIQNSLEIQHDYVEGLYNSFVSIVPIAEHLNQPNSKIVLRESDESLIEVQASSNTLSVSQVENNFSSLQLGIEKLKINNEVIVSSFNIYPGFIKDPFAKKFEFLKTQVETINGIYANYEYIPPLLGLDGQTNYLIITQDNTRYTPSGGYYSSYIYLEVDNGVISDAEANSLNIINDSPISIEDFELEELNLLSPKDYRDSEVTFLDTTYIENERVRSDITQRTFEDFLQTKIDMVVWADLNTIQRLLGDSEISVQNQIITKDNFLSSIDSLSGGSQQSRNDNIAKISVNVLIDLFNNSNLIQKFTRAGSIFSSNSVSLSSNDVELKTFTQQFNVPSISNIDYLKVGLNSDLENNLSRYPNLSITGTITVTDSKTQKNLNVKISGLDENFDSAWICVPAGSKNFQFGDVPLEFYSTNFSQNNICHVYFEDGRIEFPLEYESILFENTTESGYNFIYRLEKPSGIDVDYNIEFIFNTSDTIVPEDIPEIEKSNSFLYTGQLQEDLYFRFTNNE